MIAWQKKRISEGYKARNPNWETITAQSIDPSSKGFDVDYFRSLLVPYAKDKGYGAVRFKDEVLVTDRSFLDGARKATKKEVDRGCTV